MTEQKKLIPIRRFKEFRNNSSWEKHKIGELAEVLTGGTPKTQLKEYWNPKKIPWMSSGEVSKKRLTSTDNMISIKGLENSSARWVKEHSILIALAGQGKTRGTVAINEIPLTTNQSIAAIVPEKELYYEFLFQNLEKRYEELRLISSGDGTRGGLNKKIVSDLVVISPALEEQVKIGEFLKQLDLIIVHLQHKLEKIKFLKTAYLSEMFPAKGKCAPKRRFVGFTQDWKESNFFENVKYTIDFRGRTPKKMGLDWSENGYLALSALNVKNGYIDFNSDSHYGNQELYDKWMTGRELREGQVLFTTEAPMGNVAQVPDNKGYILSQRTIAFEVNPERITDDFLASLLRSPKVFAELSALSSGGTAKGVSQKSLSQLKVKIPTNLEEQIKIGNFFKQFDYTITLHQSKLEKLQNLKKAYLHEMFV